jgi:hypothetical protein
VKLRLPDIKIGKRFAKLLVLCKASPKNRHAMWKCQCDCGVVKDVDGAGLQTKRIKSCGCIRRLRPYESLYNYCMFHAKREHPELAHTLTYSQFLEFTKITKCNYCGEFVEYAEHNTNTVRAIRYNLDRKDNGVGYCKHNLAVCCKSCNYTKGDRFTYEQFLKIGKVIRSFHV